MDAERWQRIEQLYHSARERAPQARAAWLAEACAADEPLRAEVEAMLAADEQAGSFMAAPALALEAKALVDARPSPIGARIHRYQVISWIGAGGMGEVYLAEDTELNRKVALKLLPPAFATNAERVRRFAQEARAASALNHPNVLTIFDTGTYQGAPYLVAELLEGQELRALMRHGPVPVPVVIDYARQIVAGLAAAHEKGVVHRDLKPANLFLTTDGRIKILDFGLAKLRPPQALSEKIDLNASTQSPAARLTHSGAILGTVGYMAPEQVRGQEADQRADIFSFGVILYEMLTGERAFQGESLADVLAAVVRDDPPEITASNAQVPARLAHLVHHCLAKRPDDRVQSAHDLSVVLTALHAPANSQLETAALSTLLERGSLVKRRLPPRPLMIGTLLLMGALAYLGLGRAVGWWPFRPQALQAAANAQSWYEVGTQMLREGTYYKAKEFLEQSVQKDPQFPLARARLAEALMELDFAAEAQRQLLVVASLVPDRSRLQAMDRLTLEAVLNMVARDFSGAIASYTRMAALAPAVEQARVYFDLGRAYEKGDEPAHAIASYQKALVRDPHAAAAHLRLGAIYGQREKDLGRANAAFQRAEELYQQQRPPNLEGLAEVLFQRGMVFDAMNHLEEARAQLTRAAAMGSEYQSIRATLQLSGNSLSAGKLDQARAEAEGGLSRARQNNMQDVVTEGLLSLGYVSHARGDYSEAEKHYTDAMKSARAYNGRYRMALAQVNLGGLLVQEGRLDDGLRAAQEARAYFQTAGYHSEELQSLLIIARAQRQQGDYAAAESAYEQQLPLAFKSGDQALVALVHSGLGQLLAAQERYPEALPHIEEQRRINQALGLQPKVGYALLNRASVRWQLGDLQAARADFNEASALAGQRADGNKQLRAELVLLDAQIALGEQKLPLALRQSQEAVRLMEGQFVANHLSALSTLGLAKAFSGAIRAGQEQCQQAVKLAEQQSDKRLMADTWLALARTQALAGNWSEALTAAQAAQTLLAQQGRLASTWQASLLAARAQQALGQITAAQTTAQQASATLARLQQQWGQVAAQRYLARPDIHSQYTQLTEFISHH